jgi:Ni/Fe-hydrogenase subunit HybB-like protein
MHTDSRQPSTVEGIGNSSYSAYASGPVTKAPEWHGLVAWDLLFNNLTTGLFLVAALAELTAPAVFTTVAKAAYPVALVLLLADLICLVLDLGDPLRFHHMLRVFKPTSPMSLGTWCLTIYSLPLTVAAALSLLPAGIPAFEWTRKAAVVLGLLPALGSSVYKGVLLSTNAQPGWRDARWLGGYLTNSALLLGCAEMLVLAMLLGQERAGAILQPALVLLLLLNVVPLYLVVTNLRPALSRIYTPGQLGRLAALCIGGGTLAPLALLLAGESPLPVLAAVLLLLLGSLAMRFVIVRLPHASA